MLMFAMLVAQCMHVFCAVKNDVGNRNLGTSARKGPGIVWEFPSAGGGGESAMCTVSQKNGNV